MGETGYSKTVFTFQKIDIADREALTQSFHSFNPDKVVNLAAQAGVRYSIENPYAYMDSNLIGFLNILELCRHNNVDGLIYASSSSVYGGNEKIPFSVEDRVDKPIALYGATKRANELMAYSYSHLYGLHTTGLRYFTVYGPWGRPQYGRPSLPARKMSGGRGRPDMAYYLFTEKISKGEPIQVFNHGNMRRDFTYIDDIIAGTRVAIDMNYRCEIFNLGNHKSEHLMDVVSLIEEIVGKKAEIEFLPMQRGDVPESFADIEKSKQMLDYQPTINIEAGLKKFIDWYLEYSDKTNQRIGT